MIPERLIRVSLREPQKVTSWRNDFVTEKFADLDVRPAFCVDATNVKTLETARSWAKGYRYRDNTPEETEIPNDPQSYRLVNLEVRSEGGRAWKVVDKDNYYYDLRENCLLAALLDGGCNPGGELAGKFIWGVEGSQMKLIPVGSILHEKLIEKSHRKTLKPIPHKELVPGGIYAAKSGEKFIYLGPVNYLGVETKPWGGPRKYTFVKNGQAWQAEPFDDAFWISFMKRKDVIEKIGQADPFDFKDRIRPEKTKRLDEARETKRNLHYYYPLLTAAPADQSVRDNLPPVIQQEVYSHELVYGKIKGLA